MWIYSNRTHWESQYACTPNTGQNNLPNIFWWNIKQDYRDAMYVLKNANCITIWELQSISENEREKSYIVWWVILNLILFFHWIFSSSSLTKFVFFFYGNNDTIDMNHEGLGKSIDFESKSINMSWCNFR